MVTGSSITKVLRPHISFRCSSTSLTWAFSGRGNGVSVRRTVDSSHAPSSRAAILDRLPQPLHLQRDRRRPPLLCSSSRQALHPLQIGGRLVNEAPLHGYAKVIL